jgi:hypothetical protein
MPSNMRSWPITGHLSDSAGNVLRNSQIVIKIITPGSSQVVATAKTDNEGYFYTPPLSNGVYYIYESGIFISQLIHRPNTNAIQCYKASSENYPASSIQSFNYLRTLSPSSIQKFKLYLQIESDDVDTSVYGNSYPIYDVNLYDISESWSSDLHWMSSFFNFGTDSRITTTRFDVEYFAPITSVDKTYKRMRWAGVPGIRFYQDSNLLIPLDFFSMVPTLPRFVQRPTSGDLSGVTVYGDPVANQLRIQGSIQMNQNYELFYNALSYGDLVKMMVGTTSISQAAWYGILVDRGSGVLTFEKWLSSRISNASPAGGWNVYKLFQYDGMFQGISSIDSLIPERFTVTENTESQNSLSELYNYSGSSSLS